MKLLKLLESQPRPDAIAADYAVEAKRLRAVGSNRAMSAKNIGRLTDAVNEMRDALDAEAESKNLVEKSVIIAGSPDDDGFITPLSFKVDGESWSDEPSLDTETFLRKRGVLKDYRGTKRISAIPGRTVSVHNQSDGSVRVVVSGA